MKGPLQYPITDMYNYNHHIDKIIRRNKLWMPLLASMLFVALIPIPLHWVRLSQALTIKATYLSENSRILDVFVDGIKRSNGVLVLGTSETNNNLDGLNYWGFLNKDKSVKRCFSVLSGAGMNSSIYFPVMLANPERFKNLNILLYINPTYWRFGLNNFTLPYYKRYVGPRLFAETRDMATEHGLYKKFMKPALADSLYFNGTHLGPNDHIRRLVNTFRSYYYYDLRRFFFDTEKIDPKSQTFDSLSHDQIALLTENIDSSYNATYSFVEKNNSFPQIDTDSTFRYQELKEFLGLCKNNGVNVTVYLGPYNAIYCKKRNPELLETYEELMKNIRMTIFNADVPFIDGSILSHTPGTFLDVQHISKYGAFLTSQQIKRHYETIPQSNN